MNKVSGKKNSPSSLTVGRVVKNNGSAYVVKTEEGQILPARIKGNFRIKGIRSTNPLAVGDLVKLEPPTETDYVSYIKEILPRKNYIIRKASNLSKESHILAANIDQAFLVATIFNPETPLTFIDRFLATAEAYAVPVIIILNKADLWTHEIKEYANELKAGYEKIGYPVIFTSTIEDIGLNEIMEMSRNKISLLAGNSGVGKSSIINALVPGLKLKTGEISDTHHTGTHTTTFSELIDLPGGGALIDVPGIKGFGTIEFEPAQVSHYFPEIFKFSENCRFGNCRHQGEPGCAVTEAVDSGEIMPSRFASYLSIFDEVSGANNDDKYRKPF
ncbi:MAG: ribosome small subunit-dependent GTPase A [Muribaculaceae bacterium]|nr:ribosome small subunit-dependent GTPase A [Muribaculaceae bacterium]